MDGVYSGYVPKRPSPESVCRGVKEKTTGNSSSGVLEHLQGCDRPGCADKRWRPVEERRPQKRGWALEAERRRAPEAFDKGSSRGKREAEKTKSNKPASDCP